MELPIVAAFKATVLNLRRLKYQNNQALAIEATLDFGVPEDGEEGLMELNAAGHAIGTEVVSTNLSHAENGYASNDLAPGEFFANNNGHRKPLFDALVAAGWIVPTGKTAPSGYCMFPVCTIGEKAIVVDEPEE